MNKKTRLVIEMFTVGAGTGLVSGRGVGKALKKYLNPIQAEEMAVVKNG